MVLHGRDRRNQNNRIPLAQEVGETVVGAGLQKVGIGSTKWEHRRAQHGQPPRDRRSDEAVRADDDRAIRRDWPLVSMLDHWIALGPSKSALVRRPRTGSVESAFKTGAGKLKVGLPRKIR